MIDVEICAPDRDAMIAAAKLIGAWDEEGNTFRTDGITPSGIVYAMNFYGTKTVPTGETTTDADGNTVPVMRTEPGFYAIGRWMSEEPYPAPPGVTISPLPEDSPVKWA